MSLSALVPGAVAASGIFNFQSSRFNGAPRDKRTEGWTEAWGSQEKDIKESSNWTLDDEAIGDQLATPHPQLPIVIAQFRPAWLEQLVLRMAKMPHIVTNLNHATNEATGPLPYLTDRSDTSKPPILVGRHHPSNIAPMSSVGKNSILDYLGAHQKLDLDSSLHTDHQRSISKCFLNLIELELQPLLVFLRYEDFAAWEHVYRPQYLSATSPNSSHWMAQLFGRFQASFERLNARGHMVEFRRSMTIDRAVQRSREAYQALELQLSKYGQVGAEKMTFLLGNERPSFVDAVLWAHLAEALCDIHLVVVLADFPLLVQYFQKVYDVYFQSDTKEAWDQWNQSQNRCNAFQKLPIHDDKKLSVSGIKDAVDLMQRLSLRHHDLQEVLNTTKARRSSEPWPTSPSPTESLLYRWRMGEDLTETNPKEKGPEEENPMRKKIMRDQIRNDQVWISGVAGASAIVILLLQGSLKKE